MESRGAWKNKEHHWLPRKTSRFWQVQWWKQMPTLRVRSTLTHVRLSSPQKGRVVRINPWTEGHWKYTATGAMSCSFHFFATLYSTNLGIGFRIKMSTIFILQMSEVMYISLPCPPNCTTLFWEPKQYLFSTDSCCVLLLSHLSLLAWISVLPTTPSPPKKGLGERKRHVGSFNLPTACTQFILEERWGEVPALLPCAGSMCQGCSGLGGTAVLLWPQ